MVDSADDMKQKLMVLQEQDQLMTEAHFYVESGMKTVFMCRNGIVLNRAGMPCTGQRTKADLSTYCRVSWLFQVLLTQKCSNETPHIPQRMYSSFWQQLERAHEFHLQSLVSPPGILCQLH